MKPLCLLALAGLAGFAATPALAVGRLADVSLVDRDTGETLAARYHRGEYWVEGRPGARYAIRIRNQQGRRLLAVTSVDGINVVTGETAAVDQRGYVYDGWNVYDIAGWRKSDAEIAAFTFTAVPKSYAARTGRAANVGVIGIALFRDQPPPPAPPPAAMLDLPAPTPAPLAESRNGQKAAEAPAASADASGAGSARRDRALASPAPALGTGHGARETSVVTQVPFERESTRPNEIIRLRYDSRANLVALGVIREVAPPASRPQPFPAGSQLGYVPDP
jgi:hypothetical protein